MLPVISAIAMLGGLGVVFGLLLMLANKIFYIATDPKRDEIRVALPGANCGGCGFAGCDAFADALMNGTANINGCPVGGNALTAELASILGIETTIASIRNIASIACQGTSSKCKQDFDYHGIQDCVAANLIKGGHRSCKFACLGLGTCVKACPFDAISISKEDQIAVIDAIKCQSCGICIQSCPKQLLSMQPEKTFVKISCSATERGKAVKDNCTVGCIGCGLCARACNYGAIVMKNNLPVIDHTKCVGCMMCHEKCPTGSIIQCGEKVILEDVA